jgi:ferric-dicitrate binding protein FerR (iron transport regulator)
MQISEQTINKFFDGFCSKEEAEKIADFLQANPAALDNYFNEEWTNHPAIKLDETETATIWNNIRYAMVFNARKPVNLVKTGMAIAASLLLMLGIKWLFFEQKSIKNDIAVVADTAWKTCSNMSDTLMTAKLDDGTFVTVYPKSFIRWKPFLRATRRDVFMEGHAIYNVAKDKSKPFTVHAFGISTTALGTTFDVTASNGNICVKLYEGSVVIKAAQALKGWKCEAIYLKPAEAFIYDSVKQVFEVRPIASLGKAAATKIKPALQVKGGGKSNNWFMFNNQPLYNVLQHLEAIYNVEIECREIDLSKVYFIGKFDKSDSIESIIKTIALLKGYKVTHEGNKFVLMPG